MRRFRLFSQQPRVTGVNQKLIARNCGNNRDRNALAEVLFESSRIKIRPQSLTGLKRLCQECRPDTFSLLIYMIPFVCIALIIMKRAASQFVYANNFLRCLGFVFNDSFPPSIPPTIVIMANGIAHAGLKSP